MKEMEKCISVNFQRQKALDNQALYLAEPRLEKNTESNSHNPWLLKPTLSHVLNSPLKGQEVSSPLSKNSFLGQLGLEPMILEVFQIHGAPNCAVCAKRCTRKTWDQISNEFPIATKEGVLAHGIGVKKIELREPRLKEALDFFGAKSAFINGERITGEALQSMSEKFIEDLTEPIVVLNSYSLPLTEEQLRELQYVVELHHSLKHESFFCYVNPSQLKKIDFIKVNLGFYCADGHEQALNESDLYLNDLSLKDIEKIKLVDFIEACAGLKIELFSKSPQNKFFWKSISSLQAADFGEYLMGSSINNFSPGEKLRLLIAQFLSSAPREASLDLSSIGWLLVQEEVSRIQEKIKEAESLRDARIVFGSKVSPSRKPWREKSKLLHSETFGPFSLSTVSVDKISLPFPGLTVVCGPSGSGKSTLLKEIKTEAVQRFNLRHVHSIDMFNLLNSSDAILETLKLNVAVARLMSSQYEARRQGLSESDFDIARSKKRCSLCRAKIKTDAAGELIECEQCMGLLFDPEVAQISFRNVRFYEILNRTLTEAADIFVNESDIHEVLKNAITNNLTDLTLAQAISNLHWSQVTLIALTRLKRESLPKASVFIVDSLESCGDEASFHLISEALKVLMLNGHTIIVSSNGQGLQLDADCVLKLTRVKDSSRHKRCFELQAI